MSKSELNLLNSAHLQYPILCRGVRSFITKRKSTTMTVLFLVCCASLLFTCSSIPYFKRSAHLSSRTFPCPLLRGRLSSIVLPPSLSRQSHQVFGSDDIDSQRSIASSLLALLGGEEQAASVNASLSKQLLSRVRFLVPNPASRPGSALEETKASSSLLEVDGLSAGPPAMEKLIQWPPLGVSELARQTVEWGGDPSLVLKTLGSTLYVIPDVEGANEQKCQLAKDSNGRRFENKELNQYMAFLFEAIAALAPSVGLNVSLNRFDLFHGHMFLATGTGRLGILFHAREYPEFDKERFPINLGYCQIGSQLPYDDNMNLRNILWLAPMPDCSNYKCSDKWLAPGALFVLDAFPSGIVYKSLVSEDVDIVRTIYGDEFGTIVIDVNYFRLLNIEPEDRIFMC
eukprot:c26391_g1_i1 orf=80-1279(+)